MASGGETAAGNVIDVFRRLLEFPPDAEIPKDLVEHSPAPDGFVVAYSSQSGAAGEAAFAGEMEDLKHEASKLGQLADELRELVARHDPVELIASIAVPAGMVFIEPTAQDDNTRSFSKDAKIEYLAGLALAGPPGTAEVDREVTQKAVSLVSAVFAAALADLKMQVVSERKTGHPGINQTRSLLRAEYLFDRMAGYEVHLEEIGDEVFEPHRGLYCRELGFSPSDAVRLVRRHMAWVNGELGRGSQKIREAMTSEGFDEDADAEGVSLWVSSMNATCEWTPEMLADNTGIPLDQVAAMLDHMSVDFGCQPDFRMPFDDNQARRHPLIRLPQGGYLAAVPWSVARSVHDWLQGYIKANPASRLADKYPGHRSDAAERLVRTSLEAMFGKHAVFGNQYYESSNGPGEIDCLVAGSTPIIVEVKSRSLTDQGRRGLRRRVETVAEDVVGKSFQQTRRARDYIIEDGGRCFADRQGGRPVRLLNDDVTDPVEIVVMLERMDPLMTGAGKLANAVRPPNVWVTNLADFLMVRDILSDPASFLHYALTRGKVSEVGVQIFMESDALGMYLVNRLEPLISLAAESESEDREQMLGYSSTKINQFFAKAEIGIDSEKPSTGVPEVLLEALRNCASDYPRSWTTTATAVMATPPEKWRSWRRFVRRHKGEHPFLLPCGNAAIIASASLTNAELRSGSIPALAIPRQEARTRGRR